MRKIRAKAIRKQALREASDSQLGRRRDGSIYWVGFKRVYRDMKKRKAALEVGVEAK